MKVKEAIEIIKKQKNIRIMTNDEVYKEADKIYCEELNSRVELRSHGKPATANIVRGVFDEMNEWAIKIGQAVGLSDESIRTMIKWRRGTIFAEHKQVDPVAQDQIDKCRTASLYGVSPLRAMTCEGFEAIHSMMLGKLVQEVKECTDKGSINDKDE